MSRRPLGASIPIDRRVVVFERWIRDGQAAIADLEEAALELDTGQDGQGGDVSPAMAWKDLHAAIVRLQELKERPFRAPRR